MRGLLILAKLVLLMHWESKASVMAEQPNVIVIISDDHGFGDIGWNNPEVKTPNLDRMASEGIRLDRFYVNPICSLTRAAVMTGIATIRTGVNNRQGLDLKYRIMPQMFKDAGYQTWMFGKWHLGGSEDNSFHTPDYLPHHRGFDHFYGFLHGAIDYYTHERKDLGKLDWQRNGQPVDEEGFTTDLMVREAEQKLHGRNKDKPFLMYLAFNAVHGPLQPPPSAPKLDRRDKRKVLLANLTHMDMAIGQLMESLKKEGIERNTMVIFFGDNGGQLANGASNGPLRGEKGNVFEGGLRVPAFFFWPGKVETGQRSGLFMTAMDVMPTLAAAAGIQAGLPEGMDGVNMWPSLRDGKVLARPSFVMGTRDTALFSGEWKMVNPGGGEPPMLFRIVEDPNEKNDLAGKHPEMIKELSVQLTKFGGSASGQRAGGGGGNGKRPMEQEKRKAQGKKKGARQKTEEVKS